MYLMNPYRFPVYSSTNSMLFDGTNEYMTNTTKSAFSYIQNTNDFALSAWIKLTDYTDDSFQAIAGNNRGGSAAKGFLFNYDNRVVLSTPSWLQVYVTNGSGSSCHIRSNNNAITDNNWHHVVITTNGTTGVIYVDNSSFGLAIDTYSTLPTGDSTYDLNIGASGQAGFGGHFNGNIDEVSFWDTKLTAGQVSEIYNSGCPADLTKTSMAANLTNWWKMGEGDTYDTITDVVGGNDVTHANMEAGDLTTTTIC